jgi:hypothetical protein
LICESASGSGKKKRRRVVPAEDSPRRPSRVSRGARSSCVLDRPAADDLYTPRILRMGGYNRSLRDGSSDAFPTTAAASCCLTAAPRDGSRPVGPRPRFLGRDRGRRIEPGAPAPHPSGCPVFRTLSRLRGAPVADQCGGRAPNRGLRLRDTRRRLIDRGEPGAIVRRGATNYAARDADAEPGRPDRLAHAPSSPSEASPRW